MKMKIQILPAILVLIILISSNSIAQTKFIMHKGNEFIALQKRLDDLKLVEVQYLNGKIDTLERRLIKRLVSVTLDILTTKDNLSNVEITEIQANQYTIKKNEVLSLINLSDIVKISEHIPLQDTLINNNRRAMLGLGVGFPFIYVSYDKKFFESSGFRVNFYSIILATGITLDYYWNFPITNNIESNISLTSGVLAIPNLSGGSGSAATLIGASYDLKLYFLMIRAGLVYGITGYTGTDLILPNVSIGVVFRL